VYKRAKKTLNHQCFKHSYSNIKETKNQGEQLCASRLLKGLCGDEKTFVTLQ